MRPESHSKLGLVDIINCFSLMVVFGSISTSYFFATLFHAKLSFWFYYLLSSTIWIIYTLDHVLDGLKLKEEAISLRHYIHYKYRTTIIPILVLFALFNMYVAVAYLPQKMLIAGCVLAVLVILYFLFIHFFSAKQKAINKELIVALVVCSGMVVLPGISGNLSLSFGSACIVLSMVLINYTNLLLFSYYDYENDKANGLNSAATNWGLEKTKTMAINTLGSAFVLFVFWLFQFNSPSKLPVSIAFLIMLNILMVMIIQEDRFKQKESYRFWGDFIFLMPGVVMYFVQLR